MPTKFDRNKLSEEREKLKKEYIIKHKIWMDAIDKRDGLLPKFRVPPLDELRAELSFTTEYLSEYNKADKEEGDASTKARETLLKILRISDLLLQ